MYRLSLVLCVLVTAFSTSLSAEEPVYALGRAEVEYQSSVNNEVRNAAIDRAKVNALQSYFAKRSATDAKRFDAIQADVVANIDQYVLSSTVLGDAIHKDRHTYSVTVQVQLNVNRLNQSLVPEAKGASARPELAFLFVTRQLAEQKKYDPSVYKNKKKEASAAVSGSASAQESTAGGATARSNQSTAIHSTSRQGETSIASSVSVETGGSVTTRQAKRHYTVSSSQTFNAAFLEGLSAQDWPFDPIEVETEPSISLSAVKEDFAAYDEIQAENLQKLLTQARAAGFKYFAVGTLDISLPVVDETLEVQRVGVQVNAKVYDIGGRRTKTILSVQPILVNGFDADDLRAQAKAVREAASRSSQEFLSQLSNKTITTN